MKKRVCAAVLFLAGTAAAFAAPAWRPEFGLSAGAGGILGGHFTRYNIQAGEEGERFSADQHVNQFEGGLFVFFDATFATLAITFKSGANNFNEPAHLNGVPVDLDGRPMSRSGQGWETTMGISLLGRFPFRLTERFTVFPLLGMDYHISLMQRRTAPDGSTYDRTNPPDGVFDHGMNDQTFALSDWNVFFVRLGGGVEFDLTERLFLRGDLLYGIRLMTGQERKSLEVIEAITNDSSPSLGGLSSGPSVRLSVGWRFSPENDKDVCGTGGYQVGYFGGIGSKKKKELDKFLLYGDTGGNCTSPHLSLAACR